MWDEALKLNAFDQIVEMSNDAYLNDTSVVYRKEFFTFLYN